MFTVFIELSENGPESAGMFVVAHGSVCDEGVIPIPSGVSDYGF